MNIDKTEFELLKQEFSNINLALVLACSHLCKLEITDAEKSKINQFKIFKPIIFPTNQKDAKALFQINAPKGDIEKMPYLKEGSLRKRSDGRWEARYYDITGKQLSIYGKTQKGCLDKLTLAIKRKDKGLPPKPITQKTPAKSQYSFFEWLDKWFETYKKPPAFGLSKSRITTIEICIRLHIKPHIVDVNLKRLTGLDIQEALNLITSSKMRKETHDVYSESLRTAWKQKLIKDNPMDAVSGVVHKSVNGVPLSMPEQENFFINAPKTIYGDYFKFIILTGARPGEAKLVKWSDVDFEHKTIFIPGTKTDKAPRLLPLFPPLNTFLSGMERKGEFVFAVNKETAEDAFKELCPNHKLYDLRHTFATRCLENTVPMKVVQIWLGHAKYNTTANIYSHVLDSYSAQEGDKLSAIFDPYLYPQT